MILEKRYGEDPSKTYRSAKPPPTRPRDHAVAVEAPVIPASSVISCSSAISPVISSCILPLIHGHVYLVIGGVEAIPSVLKIRLRPPSVSIRHFSLPVIRWLGSEKIGCGRFRLWRCVVDMWCDGGRPAMFHVDVEYSTIGLNSPSVAIRALYVHESPRTFSLLNVAMTFSAPALSMKTISAITVGDEVIILQLVISPPIGVMADSMSADVVPGAKLLPTTTYGPAKPRMLIPVPAARTVIWLSVPFEAYSVSAA